MKLAVPLVIQPNEFTCGPAALQMVLKYFNKPVSIVELGRRALTTEQHGTARVNMARALKNSGLFTFSKHNTQLKDIHHFLELQLPVIVNYRDLLANEGHYGVIIGYENGQLIINDPYHSKPVVIEGTQFVKRWHGYHKTQFKHWLLVAAAKQFNQN